MAMVAGVVARRARFSLVHVHASAARLTQANAHTLTRMRHPAPLPRDTGGPMVRGTGSALGELHHVLDPADPL